MNLLTAQRHQFKIEQAVTALNEAIRVAATSTRALRVEVEIVPRVTTEYGEIPHVVVQVSADPASLKP